MTNTATTYKSPLHQMTQTTCTCLWNDSSSLVELGYAIEHGAVGATCNPVIVVEVLKKEMSIWKDRILELIRSMPTATEHEIGFLDRDDSVMCNSVFAEDENADEMARYQLATMRDHIASHSAKDSK